MAELKVGQTAPRFSLKDKDGKPFSLGSAKAEYTVLYFYPKDDTPGCTLEAKEFSSSLPKFKSRNVTVVGISGGTEKTKESFCKKYSLKVPLVSDPDFKVAKSYGAYGTKNFMGRSFQGIFRKTFLIDKKGRVVKVFGAVKPEGHASEVLEAIDSLLGKESPKSMKKGAPVGRASLPPKRAQGRKNLSSKMRKKPAAKSALSRRRGVKKR